MSLTTLLFFLCLLILFLVAVIIYQRLTFRSGIQTNLHMISQKIKAINETESDESIMCFTDNKELIELIAQMNSMLEKHREVKTHYRQFEISSQKMLSNISHDIKTPMTVILGYLEIMRLNGTASDEMLKKTEQKAQAVMELINQFFTLAKIESGDMDIELSRLDICEPCRESLLDFYEILTNHHFQVDIDIPDKPVYVLGNQDAIQRILFNLISNVIRYGDDGKYLGIQLREDEKVVYIDVIDKGQGIDRQFAQNVFERLFTMEDSRNRNIQGSGLGLTIAKNLSLQLGGNLTLKSIPYVQTIFTVELKKVKE